MSSRQQQTVRQLDGNALTSLAREASESAIVNSQTGAIYLPTPIEREVSSLSLDQELKVQAEIEARFDKNLAGIELHILNGRIQPICADWAKRAAKQKQARDNQTRWELAVTLGFLIVACLFWLSQNASRPTFDRNASIEAKNR